MPPRNATIWTTLTATALGVLCVLVLMSGCARAQHIFKNETAVVVAAAPPEAPSSLDFKSMEVRLRDTHAIGAFTKLMLKTEVDELLGQFRAFYQGHLTASLTDLRRAYDRLVFKVLALVQNGDPQLATAIASSREPLWGVLSNPAKFAVMQH